MEIRGFAWWTIGLIVVGCLFSLILLSYLMCYYFLRVERGIFRARNDLDLNYLESNSLEPVYMEPNDLYAPVIRVRRRYAFWSDLATRTYAILVIACAGVYVVSQFPWGVPPSPFWLGAVLTAFTFASAFFTYKTWRKGKEE